MITPADLRAGARLAAALPWLLRRPVGEAEARRLVARRLASRADDFLALAGALVYGVPASPYRWLLREAGCTLGDLRTLVASEGLDGALALLFRQGVYLTVDEFKGRRPVVRGSAHLAMDPAALGNPRASLHVLGHTSGSRGPRTPVPIDLASVRDHAVTRRLSLAARGAMGWRHAVWGVPGGSELVIVLRFAACGAPPEHWFSQVDPGATDLHPRYRWSGRVIRAVGRLAGVPLPAPVHVPLHEPGPILAWLGRVRRSGGTPHLKTFTSSAVRLCEAARAARADLRGVRLTVTGEPLTGARLAVMADTGAEVAPDYGSTESGQIGEPCVAPAAPDDLHLCDDLHAVVQPGDGGPARGLPPRALLLTSLRTTAPLVLLNVSLGDEADLIARACGCPMDGYGFPRHVERVRSFEKLTSEGMTFLDADVSRILETVLPARFGGGPTHYQIVDEDDARGRPGLRLLVDPAVGVVDPAAVATAFLDALGAGSGADRIMAAVWRDAGLLRVERRAPYVTGSGKILHVHRRRD